MPAYIMGTVLRGADAALCVLFCFASSLTFHANNKPTSGTPRRISAGRVRARSCLFSGGDELSLKRRRRDATKENRKGENKARLGRKRVRKVGLDVG